MNKKMNLVIRNALICCLYAALTVGIAPLSYGGIQMRFAEILIFLAFFNKRYVPGLILGCLIANLFSPMGLPDVIFGTSATAIVCILLARIKNIYLVALIGGLVNGIVVGAELYVVLQLPFIISALEVFIGEFLVLLIGTLIFKVISKNDTFMKKYINNNA